MRAVIGVDYGTRAARAVLVDSRNGEVLCSHSVAYPHGVLEGDLADAGDYESVLLKLLEAISASQYRDQVAGICVDATSLTLVPLAADGRVLCQIPQFADRIQAQIKLWKRHAAQPQADEALRLARAMREPFLGRTGGSVSSEWTLPKLMEMADEDPEAFEALDLALDLCEFLTCRLTGKLARSVGSMSFKGLWSRDLGFPSAGYLNGLRPGLSEKYRHVMRGEALRPGDPAGSLHPQLCRWFGFPLDAVVAAGTLDGHTSLAALGGLQAGDATLVVGTSNALTIQTGELCEMEGICGIAMDGLTAGLYGIDSGQNCTGDMLDWFMCNSVPQEMLAQAQKANKTPHQLLAERVERPWTNCVTALDWWNGSRNAPCDLDLRGMLAGLSLDTRPQDIYLALLQGIACGTREIVELWERNGVAVNRVLATGGIALKNALLMQEYANLLNRTVMVGRIAEGPAMGAAVFAAVAAGIYPDAAAACAEMGVKDFIRYSPDEVHRQAYEDLYRRNHALRQMAIGEINWPRRVKSG